MVQLLVPEFSKADGSISQLYGKDNIEQKPTYSNTFTFYDVLVDKDETLGLPHPPDGAISTFLGIIAQLRKFTSIWELQKEH